MINTKETLVLALAMGFFCLFLVATESKAIDTNKVINLEYNYKTCRAR